MNSKIFGNASALLFKSEKIPAGVDKSPSARDYRDVGLHEFKLCRVRVRVEVGDLAGRVGVNRVEADEEDVVGQLGEAVGAPFRAFRHGFRGGGRVLREVVEVELRESYFVVFGVDVDPHVVVSNCEHDWDEALHVVYVERLLDELQLGEVRVPGQKAGVHRVVVPEG